MPSGLWRIERIPVLVDAKPTTRDARAVFRRPVSALDLSVAWSCKDDAGRIPVAEAERG